MIRKHIGKKFAGYALVTALGATALAGCSADSETPMHQATIAVDQGGDTATAGMEAVAAGETISVLVESGSNAELTVRAVADQFTAETGINLNVEAVPYSGIYDKLSAEMVAKTGIYDVATIDIVWIPSLYPGLEPLEGVLPDEDLKDYAKSLLDGGIMEDILYAIPAWANCKIMYYRTDLFEDATEKENFKTEYGYDLKVPETWQEYRDAAKFFTRDTDGDGKVDIYGTSFPAMIGADTTQSYLDYAAQAGSPAVMFDENNEIMVTNEAHKEALDFLISLKKDGSVPDGIFEMGAPENQKMFSEGKLAMVSVWAGMYPTIADPEKSQVADKFGVAHVAAGKGGYAATPAPWYNAVLQSSKKKEASKEFVKYMHEHNGEYAKQKGIAARNSLLNDAELNQDNPQLAVMMDTLGQTQSVGRPKTEYWNEVRDALNVQIQAAIMGEIDSETALKNAAVEIKKIIE